MLAGQIFAQGDLRLVEVPEPTLDGVPDAIIFQPELTCLCGSDLPFVYEPQPAYPLPPGLSLHEMVGRVVASSGKRFRPGDRVLAVPVEQSGLFERFVVADSRAIPLDSRRPPEEMLLAQPLGTVIYAARRLPSLVDQDVAIVGQGPMGLIWTAVARNLGARMIIGLDRVPARLEMSRRMGATRVVDCREEDPAAAVAEATGGGMADVVIEAVGHVDQALNLCVDLCRPQGRIVYFGVPTETIDGIAWRELFLKNLTVHTSVKPDFTRDFPLAMRWIGEGRIDLKPLNTHRFPLARIAEAFQLFGERTSGAIKVQVEFPAAGR